MPDTNGLPRIGEIWKDGKGERVLVTNSGFYTHIVYSNLTTNYVRTDLFIVEFEPTNAEYDLDPLVVKLKGGGTE